MPDLPYSRKISELAEKWRNNSITEEEKQEFITWYNQFNDTELLLPPGYEPVINLLREQMLTDIRQRIAANAPFSDTKERGALFSMKWFRVSAAAALLLVAATGAWFLVFRKNVKASSIAVQKAARSVQQDVLPGSNKAILTLGNGSTIVLDSAKVGSLTQEGNTHVLKLSDGQLKYESGAAGNTTALNYNVLATPRGGQYKLVLPDGSQVWLNAASSIRYPTAFTGGERKVEISGEAYFEVAKNAAMPFRVLVKPVEKTVDPMEIEVLGTHFNVNGYADEAVINTTLLEGSVKLTKGKASGMLKPGQQALVKDNGEIKYIPGADIDKAVAWKNGMFEFGGEDLHTIMRQISRWYDVEIVYEGNVPADVFTGQVSRSTSLSGVIKILKLSGIQLTIVDKKIIVNS